ncbi:hypothetical protein [Micromonospora sp. NPDC049033]|uniref:hypothetical protein n=1 Tax=Micromonospora sp. NPDC049033 TaxID=3155149 RepID=UPI0033F52DBE
MLSEPQRVLRARLAATTRHHPDADVTELRTELRAATAERYIRRLVRQAPPLTPEQRARLAGILTGEAVTTDAA